MTVTLLLGGARSGKSTAAQRLAEAAGGPPVYVATARVGDGDDEFAARVARHRADRDDRWTTVEEPLDLVRVLRDQRRAGRVVVVDCLTLWLTNLLLDERDVAAAVAGLCDELAVDRGAVALVSNEVGQGIVPMHELSRRFRDEQGWCNQRVAAVADRVRLLVAGIEVPVKG